MDEPSNLKIMHGFILNANWLPHRQHYQNYQHLALLPWSESQSFFNTFFVIEEGFAYSKKKGHNCVKKVTTLLNLLKTQDFLLNFMYRQRLAPKGLSPNLRVVARGCTILCIQSFVFVHHRHHIVSSKSCALLHLIFILLPIFVMLWSLLPHIFNLQNMKVYYGAKMPISKKKPTTKTLLTLELMVHVKMKYNKI